MILSTVINLQLEWWREICSELLRKWTWVENFLYRCKVNLSQQTKNSSDKVCYTQFTSEAIFERPTGSHVSVGHIGTVDTKDLNWKIEHQDNSDCKTSRWPLKRAFLSFRFDMMKDEMRIRCILMWDLFLPNQDVTAGDMDKAQFLTSLANSRYQPAIMTRWTFTQSRWVARKK